MDNNIIRRLEEYITDELEAAEIYSRLAEIAPDDESREFLTEFADDEYGHAEIFKRLYRSLTGRRFNPKVEAPDLGGTYLEIINGRIPDESGDYRVYMEEFINSGLPAPQKNLFWEAAQDENVHAHRLAFLYNKAMAEG